MFHKKKLTKKTPDFFLRIQGQDFHISDIFYKIQNLKKWKMKAVVPFLQRNLKFHSPSAYSSLFQHIQAYSGLVYASLLQTISV